VREVHLRLLTLDEAQFTLLAPAGIRTDGKCRRAAEKRESPRWVKAEGCVHSAVRGTVGMESQVNR